MSAPDFFERYTSEFAQQAGSSQANADRHVSAERLVAKAEYELYQLRRELVDVLEYVQPRAVQEAAEMVEETVQAPLAVRAA